MKVNSAQEAVSIIESGQSVFVHTAAATPVPLVEAMSERAPELHNVKVYHMHTEGAASYADEAHHKSFEINSLFLGGNVRKAHQAGRVNFIPCFLSEVPIMIRSGVIPVDVVLIQVSPPDKHGYCSLGISIDATKAAVECAKTIIAQVNPRMPRTHGDGLIHVSRLTRYFEATAELPELPPHALTPEEKAIGEHVAALIDDRATLQMGIGAIPDAVLACLGNHKDLGVHTEMFSDGVIPLMEKGVITNKYKKRHRDVLVSGFMIGSRKLYDFVDDNPMIRMLDIEYVNDTKVIRKIDNMISINSAIEVDLTGQVCADSIGTTMYSGVGGQMDFIRGASLSKGGKPIIALTSTTRKGESKISHVLKSGAGVVTTRAHVQYVATEYGVANLYGKNLKQRAKSLIEIAHPDHREALERAAFERFR
ncbi:acetyl-CoA hydrolase/transferase family protein [Roseivirga sp. E12]|uniref:acetyl-CoA hydrolase/transferase family protein n=1 Tax=Roseivirga sp. E12 TaxID=2819237 RepID=UPI001ABCA834|nr:acetyl-CoA hydrolase/transferase family protein [Roseivirga sp. E12]MBO3700833.1 acetyl-CoA hydrolase/transferase family protein [Roseivirga sp. E12]